MSRHALSSASDDEVGGLEGAVRAAAMFAPPICRRSPTKRVRLEKILRDSRFVGFDEDGGSSEHRSERSEPLDAERKRAEQSNMFLAVDAGGTSTRAVVLDTSGRAYGYGRAGGGNPTAVGIPQAVNAIGFAAERALAGLTGSGRPGLGLIAMAGEKTPAFREQVAGRLAALGLPAKSCFGHDLLGIFHSGTPRWMAMP